MLSAQAASGKSLVTSPLTHRESFPRYFYLKIDFEFSFGEEGESKQKFVLAECREEGLQIC
jgi:hypothetical protein